LEAEDPRLHLLPAPSKMDPVLRICNLCASGPPSFSRTMCPKCLPSVDISKVSCSRLLDSHPPIEQVVTFSH
jgi:predicted amidophosphoribosyltransferase